MSLRKYLIGDMYENYKGDKFKIIAYSDKKNYRMVEFEKTGYKTEYHITQIKNKTVTDQEVPSVYNVGINDVKNSKQHILYSRWSSMLRRCYCEEDSNYKSYGAKGVTVSEELLRFSNYISVVEHLEHYDDLIREPSNWQIDKDLKSRNGNVIYTKDTLIILPNEVNKQINVEPVYQYDLNFNLISYYSSKKEASECTGLRSNTIAERARGKHNGIYGGFFWSNTKIEKGEIKHE